jgi:hypothetical protein
MNENRGERKITDKEIVNSLQQGLTATEIATEAGVTSDAIRKRLRRMGKRALPFLLQVENDFMGVQLDTMKQLAHINQKCIEIVNDTKTKPLEKLTAMKRIERQNEIQIRMMQLLYSVKEVKSFQESVLNVLAKVSPAIRDEVLKQLRQHRTAVGLLKAG